MWSVCEQDAEGMAISSAGLIIVACGMYNSCSSGLLVVRHSFSWPERPNETELAIRRDNMSNVSGRVSAGTNLDAWFLDNKPAWMQVGPGEPGVSAPNTAQPRRAEQLSCDYRGLAIGRWLSGRIVVYAEAPLKYRQKTVQATHVPCRSLHKT